MPEWAHQCFWPTLPTLLLSLLDCDCFFYTQWQNYTFPWLFTCESFQVWRPLQPCPQSAPSHYLAAVFLKAQLHCTTVLLVTRKLGASGSSLTHLINSQVCRFYFVWPFHFISVALPSLSFSVHPGYVTAPLLKTSCLLVAQQTLATPPSQVQYCHAAALVCRFPPRHSSFPSLRSSFFPPLPSFCFILWLAFTLTLFYKNTV